MIEKHYQFKYEDKPKAFSEWLKQNADVEYLILNGAIHYADIVLYDDDICHLRSLKSINITDLQVVKADFDEFKLSYVENGVQVPKLLKMILNNDYCTLFSIENGIVYSADHKMLVHAENCEQMAVPQGVEHIGKATFFAYEFNTIILPTTLRSIGDYSFCWCEKAEKIVIPESVTRLGKWSFAYAEFSNIVLPDCIEELPEGCFRSMPFLENFNFPKSLKYIRHENGLQPFMENCDVVLPEGVEVIEYYAFNEIESIYIPSTVRYLATDWFWDCSYFGETEPRQPKIKISPENPYFRVEKNKLVRNCVPDPESQREYSRKVLEYVDSQTLREYLQQRDLLFSPVEMMVIAINSKEESGRTPMRFLSELANATFLTETDRLYLDFEMKRFLYIHNELNRNWNGERYVVAYGRNDFDEKWKRIGKFTSACPTLEFEKRKLLDKYKYVKVYQYKTNDPDKNVTGSYTLGEYYRPENYWVANIDLKIPTKLKAAIRKDLNLPKNAKIDIFNTLSYRYILLPIPYKRGDVVKHFDGNDKYVVIGAEMVSDERMKCCDNYDMAITVAPEEYTELVRSCGDGELPEEVWTTHYHFSIFELEKT